MGKKIGTGGLARGKKLPVIHGCLLFQYLQYFHGGTGQSAGRCWGARHCDTRASWGTCGGWAPEDCLNHQTWWKWLIIIILYRFHYGAIVILFPVGLWSFNYFLLFFYCLGNFPTSGKLRYDNNYYYWEKTKVRLNLIWSALLFNQSDLMNFI